MTETLAIPDDIHLADGGHEPNDRGEYCFVEAWAYLRGLPWSDRPDCMSPVMGAFLRAWNDGLPDADRSRLLAPLLVRDFPRGSDEVEVRRAYLALDWLIRVHTPAWLRLVPALAGHADTLAALPEIVDMATAASAGDPVRAARAAAGNAAGAAAGAAAGNAAGAAAGAAARDAARAAAGNAAGAAAGAAAGNAARDAAWAAAGNAAWDAAWDAAGNAAWDAAGNAAWDAAGNAAGDALLPTVEQLQTSALDLIDRMAAVTA